tara:strand:- start:9326 stop:9736 length:411 start_codon:yes stop_codon:yes gene_type:complete
MRKGIIIIFGKNDVVNSNNLFLKSFFNKHIKICLINNGNNDEILEFLNELKYSSKCDISILNLKKEKTPMSAVKAGVRFLSTSENFNLIVYTKKKNIFTENIIRKIVEISKTDLMKKKDERILLRKVYSVSEIINC